MEKNAAPIFMKMEYQGTEYTVVRGIECGVWKWSAAVAGMVPTAPDCPRWPKKTAQRGGAEAVEGFASRMYRTAGTARLDNSPARKPFPHQWSLLLKRVGGAG
jgi:hypothetical protein